MTFTPFSGSILLPLLPVLKSQTGQMDHMAQKGYQAADGLIAGCL